MPAAAKIARPNSPVVYTNEQIINAATGHWGEIAQEIKPAEPYQIDRPGGDPIVILPLTRRRRKKLKAAQAAYLMIGAQLTEAQTADADQATITRISKILDEAEYEYDSALFGEGVVDEVQEYFDDLQEEFWDAMYQDVHDKLVNRVQQPEDVCPKCHQKIGGDEEVGEGEEGPGKEPSSSTSSSSTGTNSKATSTTTST
jgi:hypothetical protein